VPDLHIPILGQLAPAPLPLGDALKPGLLEIVSLDAPAGVISTAPLAWRV